MVLVFVGSAPLRGPSGVDDLRRKDGADDTDAAFARIERASDWVNEIDDHDKV